MGEKAKQWGKAALSLLAVVAISAGLLFGMEKITGEVIESQKKEEVKKAFSGVISGDRFEKIETNGAQDVRAAYRVMNDKDETLGFAVTTLVKGYGGMMEVHVALSADATRFLGVRIGSHQESPGYGAKVAEQDFYGQFNSLSAPASVGGYTGMEESVEPPVSGTLHDGSYRAEQATYEQGYKNFVELKVEGGRITAVNWDALKEGSDTTKKAESQAGTYVMTETGPRWHEQAKTMEDALVQAQDPARLVYDPDTGKTDAYAGVSVDVGVFVQLALEAVDQAKTGDTGTALWKNGTYRAERDGYTQGYRYFVEIQVEGGRITAVNWDALKEGSDTTKKAESQAGTYVMTETGPRWHEQAKTMEDALIELQNPARLVYDPDTGKTDAYAGVSVDVSEFVQLSMQALEQASAGNPESQAGAVVNTASVGEIDAVSGATISSKAVVRAANRAYQFVESLVRG